MNKGLGHPTQVKNLQPAKALTENIGYMNWVVEEGTHRYYRFETKCRNEVYS